MSTLHNDVTEERWQVRLKRLYPEIVPASCAINCRQGWAFLLELLCNELTIHADKHHKPPLAAKVIEEKFGSLRFQTQAKSEVERALIRMVARISERICEVCGSAIGRSTLRSGRCARCESEVAE